jgi:16S rRNA processing protein RimM
MRKTIQKEACTEIGFVKKTHGVKGELQINYPEGIEDIIDGLDYIFFEVEGLLVPFFVETVYSSNGMSAIIKFETLDLKEKAAIFAGCKLFVESEKLTHIEDHFAPSLLIGFTLYDQNKKKIGLITEISDYGGNVVFTLGEGKNEQLVPFHSDLLIDFFPQGKTITVHCPEGISTLNDGTNFA